MRRTRFTIFAMLLLIAGTLVLAACGGDDDDSADDTASEQTSAVAEDTSPAEEATEDDEEATEEATEADDGEDSGGGEVADACGYLTQAEVEAALGEPVQAPVVTYTSTVNISGTAQAEVGTCNYVSPEGFSSISLTAYASDDEDAIAAMAEAACQGKETLDAGDQACWYDDSHVEVQVADGGTYLDIFITSSGDTTAIGETLAEQAVD